MANNANLHQAKRAKNDEFYTQLSDIEAELRHYKRHFRDKVVLCNCDDPYSGPLSSDPSNFTRYFLLNFKRLGLKKLICTGYAKGSLPDATGLSNDGAKRGYKLEVTADDICDMNGDGAWDIYDVDALLKSGRCVTGLHGDENYAPGDFRSDECILLLDEADIVVTNPPFSLLREYVALLIKKNKKFCVIGSMNAITYKEIFPLIRDNKLWIGYAPLCADMVFGVPEGTIVKDSDRAKAARMGYVGNFTRLGNSCWFTNMDHKKRHESLLDDLANEYYKDPSKYPTYDNYDAINVDKVREIPIDYYGVMGVPITYLDKYNPDEFEIVAFRKGSNGKDLVFTREREREYNRTFASWCAGDRGALSELNELGWDDQERGGCDRWQEHLRSDPHTEAIDMTLPIATNLANGLVNDCKVNGHKTYVRILIRRKAD